MSGYRQSISIRQLFNRFEALNAAYGGMLAHGLTGGPEYDLHRDRFNALKEATRDQARADGSGQ